MAGISILILDRRSGVTRRRAIPYPAFVDEAFTGGGTTFTLVHTLDSDTVVDVFVGGSLQLSTAYSVDVGLHQITLSEAVNSLQTVRVRIYLH